MDEYESLSHTKWECKYHVVFIPKCRRKMLYEQLRRHLGEVFRELARAEGEPDRGRAFDDGSCAHVDRDTAEVCGVASGRVHQGEERDPFGAGVRGAEANFVGQHFWARGYFVSTVGRDEKTIREYIRKQEQEDKRLDQLNCNLRATFWWHNRRGPQYVKRGRVSDPASRFERLNHKAPGFAGGYVTSGNIGRDSTSSAACSECGESEPAIVNR